MTLEEKEKYIGHLSLQTRVKNKEEEQEENLF